MAMRDIPSLQQLGQSESQMISRKKTVNGLSGERMGPAKTAAVKRA
jgi:hypothetical protein